MIELDQQTWQSLKQEIIDFLFQVGPNVLLGVFILVFGIYLIRLLTGLLSKSFRKYNLEPSLATFFKSLIRFILYALLIVTVATTMGVETSSFVALIGAAGLAIGLALQGSLANFAGGVIILIFKPFRVGDLIEVNDNLGHVDKIDILYTRLRTFDHRIITMPNGEVAKSNIDNRTMESERRVDMEIKVSYETDLEKVREIVIAALKKHPKALEEPEPDLWLDEMREFDMKLKTRCWVRPEDYYPTYWEQMEAIKNALDENGISIPIPKRDVYLRSQQEN